ncbi:MAG: two-CW domain-containing protein [Candidatus Zixiibacteriota bacterium]
MEFSKNCWQLMNCGREPGGENADQLGICPVSTSKIHDGINHGTNAGRVCWAVTGTLCGGKVQGSFAVKFGNCLKCPVFKQVTVEEERSFVLLPPDNHCQTK